ncbi:hypothetical protein F5Y17DRAFT_462014 [Xylariaceae sp. FL0594]|nr:hypothetical protein F5Y17DRAFT_462014 [Xylariaceae sp. FL0594]
MQLSITTLVVAVLAGTSAAAPVAQNEPRGVGSPVDGVLSTAGKEVVPTVETVKDVAAPAGDLTKADSPLGGLSGLTGLLGVLGLGMLETIMVKIREPCSNGDYGAHWAGY